MNEGARQRLLVFAALLALSSCSPTETEAETEDLLATSQAPIVGGSVTTGDPEVFMLTMLYSNGSQSRCSATLINRRTLVTAAHCVDPRVGNSQSVIIWATNDTYALSTGQSENIQVTETALHPQWSPAKGTLEHDLALLLLTHPPTLVVPKPWNTSNIAGYIGRSIRAVGFGTTGPGAPNSAGVKREVALTFRNIDADHIYLGDMQGKGVCNGDSGGPSFHTFSDGIERLVGVHSYTMTEACVDGADIRVDAYATWINGWMNTHEGPQCSPDGACVDGCAPVDQDCVCVKDSVCSSSCLDPAMDPDCPQNCVSDGVCQPNGCAVADEDCVPEGQACTTAAVCPGKRCVNDPQHDALYCSRSCAVDAECPNAMACGDGACRFIQLPNIAPHAVCVPNETYCIGRLTCAGLEGEPTRCVASCESDSHCPLNVPCVDSAYGRFCRVPDPAPVLVPLANAEAPLAEGCSTVPDAFSIFSLVFAGLAAQRGRWRRGMLTAGRSSLTAR